MHYVHSGEVWREPLLHDAYYFNEGAGKDVKLAIDSPDFHWSATL
jgi:hypothetical protein